MKDPLSRFGVAMEKTLLDALDALVEARGTTRSELLRDLVRAEVSRQRVKSGEAAVGALTLIYDHHVKDLTERLTELQHALGDAIRSTMHVHLDHDRCLEVVVLRGPADVVASASQRMLAARGVKHGGLELIADVPDEHSHSHSHPHSHSREPPAQAPAPRRGGAGGRPRRARDRRSR